MSEVPTFPDEQFTAPTDPIEHNRPKSRQDLTGNSFPAVKELGS